MSWHETDDVERWLTLVGHLLLDQPGVHTISLSVASASRARYDGTRFLWWQEPDGAVTGAASATPPYPVVLAVVPEHALDPLAEQLVPSGVNGRTEQAVHFAALAGHRQGTDARLVHAERLFRLGTLTAPTGVLGSARLAGPDDEDLLVPWHDAFVAETGVQSRDSRAAVKDRLSYDGLLLWEADGQPVAMAGRTRESFGGIRIGPVFTPVPQRGRGYGGAVTAELARLAQGLAREVVLFTDLTNATSNALYQRLGFRPVHDRAVLTIG